MVTTYPPGSGKGPLLRPVHSIERHHRLRSTGCGGINRGDSRGCKNCQRACFLYKLYRQNVLAAGVGHPLSSSRHGAGMAGSGRGSHSRPGNFPRDSLHAAVSLPRHGLVLVSGNPGARDRARPGRAAGHGRPVHLCPPHRSLHNDRLGNR